MSFLLDPPLLVASGALIESIAPTERSARVLEAGVATGFVVGSTAIYLNKAGRPLWESFGEKSGRDFMWNSGVLSLNHERGGRWTHVAAAGILATYPLWVRWGRRLASRRSRWG